MSSQLIWRCERSGPELCWSNRFRCRTIIDRAKCLDIPTIKDTQDVTQAISSQNKAFILIRDKTISEENGITMVLLQRQRFVLHQGPFFQQNMFFV